MQEKPEDIKRRGYLSFFKDGVADGLINGVIDETKLFSAYYKQGYDYGLVLYEQQNNQPSVATYETWEQENGR